MIKTGLESYYVLHLFVKKNGNLVMPDSSGMSNEELKFLKGEISIVILEELHV